MRFVTRLIAILSLALLAGGYFNGAYIMAPANLASFGGEAPCIRGDPQGSSVSWFQ
jgi:hypothetical protein